MPLIDLLERLLNDFLRSWRALLGAASSFLDKAIAIVAKQIWALIVFLPGVIRIWLIERVKM